MAPKVILDKPAYMHAHRPNPAAADVEPARQREQLLGSSVKRRLEAYIAENPVDKTNKDWRLHMPKAPLAEEILTLDSAGEEFFWSIKVWSGGV